MAIERLDWKEQTVVRLRFFEDMKLEGDCAGDQHQLEHREIQAL